MENKVGGYDKSPINLLLFYLCLRVWGPQPRKQMSLRLHSTRGACGRATGRLSPLMGFRREEGWLR